MAIFCAAVSAFCLLYYIIIIAYAGIGSSFSVFWLFGALGFGALALLFYWNGKLHFFERVPKALLISVCVMASVLILLFVFLFGCVISGMVSKPEKEADYCIVLGAQIRGERITKSLRKRLDTAIAYYEEHRDVILIVSGGQGEGENVSEAQAMKAYLEETGVPEENIIVEDKSVNTNENLSFSYAIICERGDANANILICSNNFHIFRAVRLAKHIGIEHVEGLAAGSDNILLLSYMVRDSLAIFKEFLIGNISIAD